MDVPGKAAFYSAIDEWDMNRAWQLAEHRQAYRRADEQADWQAGGQMSRQVLLMLITV